AGLLQLELQGSATIARAPLDISRGCDGCLHSARLEHTEQLLGQRPIDSDTPEGNAPRLAVIDVSTSTVVAQDTAANAIVADMEHSTATPASKEPSQEPSPTTAVTTHLATDRMGIVSHELLVPLVGLPGDVARMMVSHQHRPLGARFPMAVCLAMLTIDDDGLCPRLAPHVCSR